MSDIRWTWSETPSEPFETIKARRHQNPSPFNYEWFINKLALNNRRYKQMAHQQQIDFCNSVKELHPKYFDYNNINEVLDIGSLDINGNNRYLWSDCSHLVYTGIDIGPGKNVDYVCSGHLWKHPQGRQYDVIISTECFEHDKHYAETLRNAYNLLKSGGLLMFTCAALGRPEHGTTRTSPPDSPFTNDYYKNLSKEDIMQAFEVSGVDSIGDVFSQFFFQTRSDFPQDLYFWGIKR